MGVIGFQSSPGPKAGCNAQRCWRTSTDCGFQSSPGPKAGCNVVPDSIIPLGGKVSILTRPESRMQRFPFCRCDPFFTVSILTRPESRMQLYSSGVEPTISLGFNPHPARKPDATSNTVEKRLRCGCFNPHPARKPDATAMHRGEMTDQQVSILTRPESRMQLHSGEIKVLTTVFQSSPGPKAGCNRVKNFGVGGDMYVSILTRPESRMQHGLLRRFLWHAEFQSSPGPKAGCNRLNMSLLLSLCWFQSSPGPKAGCNIKH